jgi:hypothetical protein
MEHPLLVLVVELDLETILVLVVLVVLVVVVMVELIQDREQQELPTLEEVAAEVPTLQQELQVVLVSSSLPTQPHK